MSEFNPDHNLWGLDLGGTKIEGVILTSAHEPEVLARYRVPTGASEGHGHILGQLAELVDQLAAKAGYRPAALGSGTLGTVGPPKKLQHLSAQRLARAHRPRTVAGPAGGQGQRCQLLCPGRNPMGRGAAVSGSQSRLWHHPGHGHVPVVNGPIIGGYHGIGGEWGPSHLSASEGDDCFCGKTDCLESSLAGPALERYYGRHGGQPRPLREIAERGPCGGAAATQTMARLCHFFGLALSTVVNLLDPDVIVIGGGVGNIDCLYQAGVASVHAIIFDRQFEAPVVKPLLGDSAGVFGAAYLVAAPVPALVPAD